MAERLAFDLSRYTDPHPLTVHPAFPIPEADGSIATQRNFNAFALTEDLSALVLEASVNLPVQSRINPFTLTLLPDGRVVSDALGGDRDVSTYYSDETVLDRREKIAGLKMRSCLICEPPGTVAVWFSPSGGPLQYHDGRIVVGINGYSDRDGNKVMHSYGIVTGKSSDELLAIGDRFTRRTQAHMRIADPEDLREEVFIIRNVHTNPFAILRREIPMDEVWDAIEYGEADRMKARARQDAAEAFEVVKSLVNMDNLSAGEGLILLGAALEQVMIGKGWGITSGACGTLNKDIRQESVADLMEKRYALNRTLAADQIMSETTEKKYVHRCPKCGKAIESTISKGYTCTCGGVYEGC